MVKFGKGIVKPPPLGLQGGVLPFPGGWDSHGLSFLGRGGALLIRVLLMAYVSRSCDFPNWEWGYYLIRIVISQKGNIDGLHNKVM
jgi:hypothetical protein